MMAGPSRAENGWIAVTRRVRTIEWARRKIGRKGRTCGVKLGPPLSGILGPQSVNPAGGESIGPTAIWTDNVLLLHRRRIVRLLRKLNSGEVAIHRHALQPNLDGPRLTALRGLFAEARR